MQNRLEFQSIGSGDFNFFIFVRNHQVVSLGKSNWRIAPIIFDLDKKSVTRLLLIAGVR